MAETLLSPLGSRHPVPGPALLQVFSALGLRAWTKHGANGRANPLSWARGAKGNATTGRDNRKCHKKGPLVLFSSWKAVPASKL